MISGYSNNLPTIKIIDFGLSCSIYEKKNLKKKCGTPGYIAPEILKMSNPYG